MEALIHDWSYEDCIRKQEEIEDFFACHASENYEAMSPEELKSRLLDTLDTLRQVREDLVAEADYQGIKNLVHQLEKWETLLEELPRDGEQFSPPELYKKALAIANQRDPVEDEFYKCDLQPKQTVSPSHIMRQQQKIASMMASMYASGFGSGRGDPSAFLARRLQHPGGNMKHFLRGEETSILAKAVAYKLLEQPLSTAIYQKSGPLPDGDSADEGSKNLTSDNTQEVSQMPHSKH